VILVKVGIDWALAQCHDRRAAMTATSFMLFITVEVERAVVAQQCAQRGWSSLSSESEEANHERSVWNS
jgi:hypothetical protein